jgi:hypothetical protein
MEFEQKVVQQAWSRAAGHCECERPEHKHPYGKCNLKLAFDKRGSKKRGGWEAHCKDPADSPMPRNCEILCWDCYSKVS